MFYLYCKNSLEHESVDSLWLKINAVICNVAVGVTRVQRNVQADVQDSRSENHDLKSRFDARAREFESVGS